MILTIKRNTGTFAQVEIDERTVYTKKLMGEHKITAEFYSEVPLVLQIGDYIEFLGEVFTINGVPKWTKLNLKTHNYRIEFEGQIYNLLRKRLRSSDGLVVFTYLGTALDQLNLLLTNINSIDPGWTIGEVDTTPEILMEYSKDSCRSALTRIAEKYGLEFSLSGKEISLKKTVGRVTAHRFEYGRGKGLYSIERKQVVDQNVVTRVYGFGGSKNIRYDYRNGAKQLVFEERYIEKNVDLYGVIEGEYINEEIYPKRTGTLTNINVVLNGNSYDPNISYVEDSSIDFDINEYEIEGETKKIVFKTGDLTGYEFDIWKYDHANKRIYFNLFSEQDGYTLPNSLNQPSIGDEYTLVNISMPQSYEDSAELDLKNETQEFTNQNCVPQVVYGLSIDQKYVKANTITLDTGDMVTAVDTQLGIDDLIRVAGISFPLVNVNKLTADIANFVPYTIQERITQTAVQAKKEAYFVDRRSAERARQNTAAMNRLKNYLLDQDNYFDAPIRPRSIETLHLAVGAVASNFRLNGATFKENYGGNANSFNASACQLIHLEVEISLGNIWQIGANTFSGLTSATAYYLYAKCSKTQLTGVWVLTSDVLASDPGDGQYYFGCGVLLPVDENGIRKFITTYGKTFINGREITTGRVQSASEENYLDLDSEQFNLGNANAGMDWNVSNPDTLTIRGALVQSQAGAEFPLGAFRGTYNATYTYYKGDQVTYGGETWLYINNASSIGQTPAENTYWTKVASKGDQGVPGAAGEDGQSLYTWVKYADDASGTGLSNDPTGKEYIGFAYNKTTPTESTNPADYTWSLMTGEGVPGEPGEDGTTFYTWIKYSDNADGTGLYDTPTANTMYIGIAVNKTTATESTNKADYTWSKFKGDQGVPGNDGADGTDGNFTEFRYAKNGSTTTPPTLSTTSLVPSGWSTTPPTTGDLEYLWFTKAVKNAAGSALISNWTTPVRIKGEAGSAGTDGQDGQDGAQGPAGPSVVYRGVYSSSATYYGTATRVDVVQYSGSYYVARTDAGTFSGVTPTNTTKWNGFGAQFESVATDLLFASLAYIDNLGVKYLRTGTTGQRVFIDGSDGSMHFYNASGVEVLTLASGTVTALAATIKSSTGAKRIEISTSTNEMEFYEGGALKVKIGSNVYATYPGVAYKSGSRAYFESGSQIILTDSTYGTGFIQGALASSFYFQPKVVTSFASAPNNTIFYNDATGRLVYKDMSGGGHNLT